MLEALHWRLTLMEDAFAVAKTSFLGSQNKILDLGPQNGFALRAHVFAVD